MIRIDLNDETDASWLLPIAATQEVCARMDKTYDYPGNGCCEGLADIQQLTFSIAHLGEV
jgi:hypothetical protein